MDRDIMARHMSTCKGLDLSKRTDYVDPEYEMSNDDLDRVLREVFSVDPCSGLPNGDISYFLSKDGNPTVKAWLESNLLHPRNKQSTNLKDLSDDFIAEYARNDGESVEAYSERLQGYYDEAKKFYEDNMNKSD